MKATARDVTVASGDDVALSVLPRTVASPRVASVSSIASATSVTPAASTALNKLRQHALWAPEQPLPDATSDGYKKKIAAVSRDRAKHLHALPEIPATVTQELAAMDNYYVSLSDPRDFTVRGIKTPSIFRPLYMIVRNFYVQIVAFLLYVTCVVMVLVQCFGRGGSTCWFTFILTCLFAAEMVVLILFQQLRFRLALRDRYWRFAEPIIVTVGFILELAAWLTWGSNGYSGGFTAVVWLRLLLFWLPHGRSRWEQLEYGVRSLCSADRRRYVGEGYDLDLAYVHRNIAAMGWPAYNYERFFRNRIEDVAGFLDRKHPGAYLVVNLCSERTYSSAPFHEQTSWYPLDDHGPAEIELMLAYAHEATDFILEDPNSRVVVGHCKGGKGRSGLMCCALLLFSGLKRSADDALQHFSLLRTRDGASAFQGVQGASQERYVRYFAKMLEMPNLTPPERHLRIRGLRLNNIPWLWYTQGIGKLWFAIIVKPCTDRKIVFLSNEGIQFSTKLPDPSTYSQKQIRELFATDEDNLYRESNQTDPSVLNRSVLPNTGAAAATETGAQRYRLDTSSFWICVNGDRSRRLSYEDFYATHAQNFSPTQPATTSISRGASAACGPPAGVRSVSIELKDPERLPVVTGDVVFKFFYARNNPSPLEPPVQFWLHPGFETDSTIVLDRAKLDGPPKDKKVERYPIDFSVELDAEYLVSEEERE